MNRYRESVILSEAKNLGSFLNERPRKQTEVFRFAERERYVVSLQYSIHNVQLPVAACRQTHIVGYNEQSFVAIACEI